MGDCSRENTERYGQDDHSHHHGHSHNHKHEESDGSGASLYPFIDKTKILCLNEAQNGMAKGIIKPWDKRLEPMPRLESEEGDAELIIFVPFTCSVKLRSFCIVSAEKDHGPNKVKIFINNDRIDFDNVQDMTPVQKFDVVEDFEAAIDYPVQPSKFNDVFSVTLFIPSNHTTDSEAKTMLSYLGFKGEGSEIKRGVVKTTYEASAQLKDHKKVEADSQMQSYLS